MSCSACEGGLNQIVGLAVPGIDRTDGAMTDVSGLVGSKSIEISGTYEGSYVIMGSHDGVHPVPLLAFNSGAGAQSFKQTINLVVRFMFVRRRATNLSAVTVSVGSRATCACAGGGVNNFIAFATVPAGAQVGPKASVDLWAIVPPTGLDSGFNLICAGDFVGTISVEGSLDGVQFNPVGFFTLGNPQLVGPSEPTFELAPVVVDEVVRYLRLRVMPGTVVTAPVFVTAGGAANCECPSTTTSIDVVDSVDYTGTTLVAFDSTEHAEGDLCWVRTVGAYFRLANNSTLTVDDITVVVAAGKPAGWQWLRLSMLNLAWQAQETWFVDPQNAYGTSHDENDGLTAATALLTYDEHARRWFDALITSATVTCRSNYITEAGNAPTYTFYTAPSVDSVVTFEGVPTRVYPAVGDATIGTWTPEAAAAAADDNQLVDAGIPASFTASGVLADGILLQRTSGAAQYFFAAKDLGGAPPAATLRTSNPYTLAGVVGSLANGDTYVASSLPTIGPVRFPNANDGSVTFRFLNHEDVDGRADKGMVIRYLHCWRSGAQLRCFAALNLATQLAASSELVIDAAQIRDIHLNVAPLLAWGGMVRADGTGEVIVTARAAISTNRLTLQGVAMNTRGKTMHMVRLTCHDVTRAGRGPCVVSAGGLALFIVSGCIGGKGNTGKLLNAGEGAGSTRTTGEIRIAGSGAVCVAGSSTDPAPIVANNNSYTVAQLPQFLGGGNGQTNVRSGVDFQPVWNTVANGVQVVAIGATGPAALGTPGAPAGWKLEYVNGLPVYFPFWQ